MFTADNESGFTLVELMVVVVIIGIMAGIGIPSFIKILPRMRLNNTTMVLSNEIAVARMRAISKSSEFNITFDTDKDSYTLHRYTMTALGPPAVWEWANLGTTFIEGTDLVSVTNFDPVGTVMITSAMGLVNVKLDTVAEIILQELPVGSIQKRILIEQMGRMKVQRRRDGGTWVED